MLFPLFTTGGINSVLFGIYGNQLRVLQSNMTTEEERKKSWRRHVFVAGSVAGFIQSFFACPSELIKIRQQTRNCKLSISDVRSFKTLKLFVTTRLKDFLDYRRGEKRGPLDCAREIIAANGYFGLYRGLLLTICR